ncbi:MAG TPA: 50S ribosomal protein L25, partial [Rhizobiaceae bacterium]|nr:50S ribosomal protein L25 [Rhizobiaceae bacterium]
RHEVEVYCMADSIPEFLVGDLEGLNINDGIHISHVKLPEGVTPVIHDRDFAIATIASGGGKIEEEPAAGA